MTNAEQTTTTELVLPDSLYVDGLEYAVHRSGSRRSIGITVDRDGALILSAPVDSDLETLVDFAHRKRMWVYKKLAEKDLLLSNRPTKEFVSGEGFTYLGRSHRLQLVDRDGPNVKLERGRLVMRRDTAVAGNGPKTIVEWYRYRAQRWLPQRVEPWARRMGVSAETIDVRDLGYRWGSLGKSGRINFHWATIQLSPTLVDYVIVHELAHIQEPNHTPEFWLLVERVLPNFQITKSELARVGSGLWLGHATSGHRRTEEEGSR